MRKKILATCVVAFMALTVFAQGTVIVKKNNVTFRATADGVRTDNIIDSLNMGDVLTYLNTEGDWVHVKDKANRLGYIYGEDADITEDVASAKTDDSTQTIEAILDKVISEESEKTGNESEATSEAPVGTRATFPCSMKSVTVSVKGKTGTVKKTYNVADINDVKKVYRTNAVKNNCFFVVSKQEFRLYVYEVVGGDTLLAAHYPICYARNAGPKTRTGDMSTPECSAKAPARIMQIQDYSKRAHDFKDGRGSILSYGHWFMRLDLSKSDCASGCRNNTTIGIHGSTNNHASVPGRDSEGCIRLRDEDIIDLNTRFAHVGTHVIIKSAKQEKLPFEVRAEKKCTNYQYAVKGYKQY